MKIKSRYGDILRVGCNRVKELDLSTEELIARGLSHSDGQIEELQSRLDNLTRIVAVLIDRSKLTDDEILEITQCHQYVSAESSKGD